MNPKDRDIFKAKEDLPKNVIRNQPGDSQNIRKAENKDIQGSEHRETWDTVRTKYENENPGAWRSKERNEQDEDFWGDPYF